MHVETSIIIDKSRQQLYSFWREFKNLPLFMKHLESVTSTDEGRTHWVAKGIGGIKVEWDAEIYNEIENELIAWRSVDNTDVVNAGSVRFQAAPTGHGTYVRVTLNYNPPAGSVGATLGQLLGAEPGQLIKEELRRLKQLMETGEIATIDGQSSGRAEGAMRVTAESVNKKNEREGIRMESKAKLLGHPIHQMLVPIPFGLLATAVIFDLIIWYGQTILR